MTNFSFQNQTTKFTQIINAFRRVRKPPTDKSIFLMFEGEKLQEEDAMQDSEVADLESLEVHIK